VPRRALVDTLRARGLALTCYVVVSAGDASEIAAPGVHRLEVGRVAADLAASGGG
jgi:hypothetical protein